MNIRVIEVVDADSSLPINYLSISVNKPKSEKLSRYFTLAYPCIETKFQSHSIKAINCRVIPQAAIEKLMITSDLSLSKAVTRPILYTFF